MLSDYRLDAWGSIPGRGKGFSYSLCVQTSSEAHPTSCSVGTRDPFLGSKAQPRRDTDHSPASSAKVKNE
jgi:hypothetical protein